MHYKERLDRVNIRLRQHSEHNLKSHYTTTMLVAMSLTLAILLAAFRYSPVKTERMSYEVSEQEVITMEEIIPTDQQEIPPPPPNPVVPIEVPNDEVLEDDELNLDSFLDLDIVADIPAPPKPEEEPEEPEIFMIVEQYPELISIDQIDYPIAARRAGIEGRVLIQMVIDEKGDPVSLKIAKNVHGMLAKEALRVAETAKFKPGMQRGRAVKVQISIPINFRLN